MKTKIVSNVPACAIGSASESPIKPPTGSSSAVIIAMISPVAVRSKWRIGNRSTRWNSS